MHYHIPKAMKSKHLWGKKHKLCVKHSSKTFQTITVLLVRWETLFYDKLQVDSWCHNFFLAMYRANNLKYSKWIIYRSYHELLLLYPAFIFKIPKPTSLVPQYLLLETRNRLFPESVLIVYSHSTKHLQKLLHSDFVYVETTWSCLQIINSW